MEEKITADPEFHALCSQLEYLDECGLSDSAAAAAVRARLRLLRSSYKLSKAEVKP